MKNSFSKRRNRDQAPIILRIYIFACIIHLFETINKSKLSYLEVMLKWLSISARPQLKPFFLWIDLSVLNHEIKVYILGLFFFKQLVVFYIFIISPHTCIVHTKTSLDVRKELNYLTIKDDIRICKGGKWKL